MKRHLLFLSALGGNLLFYLLLTGLSDKTELAAGIATAVTAAVLLRKARSGPMDHFVPSPRWLRPAWMLPGAVLQESWLLLTALMRQLVRWDFPGGGFVEIPLQPLQDPKREFARLAVATFFICLTPNDYVVHIDPERGTVRIRILVGRELSRPDRAFLELE